jgi:hypothetical protein
VKYLILAFVLSGCATQVQPTVLTQQNYLVRSAPASLKMLPPLPAPIPAKPTNLQVARWISENEKYLQEIEARFHALVSFYESKP